MGLPLVLAKYRPAIEAELRTALAGGLPSLYGMLRYHLGWLDEQGRPSEGAAGKALRPTLCLLICEALGGSIRTALPAAAAVELLHNASLIHDDIQDGDRERRHRPAVWALWGAAQALNAGNALASLATLSLQRLSQAGVPATQRLRAHQLLHETCLSLVAGQCLDLGFERRLDVTVPEYLAMAERKTAATIACALEMGGLLAGAAEPSLRALRRCGRSFGLAFQIGDDLLGIYGDPAATGKPVGGDILRRKKTLPVVYALEHASPAAQRRLAEIYAAPPGDGGAAADVTAILSAAGARRYAQRQAEVHCACAARALCGLALPPWAAASLEELARFLASRQA